MDITHIDFNHNDGKKSYDINVKDGKITNKKIAEGADINGSKLKNGSVSTEKLVLNEDLSSTKFAFLKGKKVLFIGDSITDRRLENASKWPEHFCSLTGAIEYNRGISGAPITTANGGTRGVCQQTMYYYQGTDNRGGTVNWGYDNTQPGNGFNGFPQGIDLIIIYAGQNDWGLNKTIGSPEAEITLTEQSVTYAAVTRYFLLPTTLCNCLKFTFRKLRAVYTDIPIFFLGMHHVNPVDGAFSNSNNWREYTNWNYSTLSGTLQTKTNGGETVNMESFRQAISSVCKMFGVPVIDLFDMQMSALLEDDKTAFFSDGLHINSDGGKIMAKYVANKICEYTNNTLRGL